MVSLVSGWGIGIRTPTNRVRVCRATVTQFPNVSTLGIIYQNARCVKIKFALQGHKTGDSQISDIYGEQAGALQPRKLLPYKRRNKRYDPDKQTGGKINKF